MPRQQRSRGLRRRCGSPVDLRDSALDLLVGDLGDQRSHLDALLRTRP